MKFTQREIGDLLGYEIKVLTHRMDDMSFEDMLKTTEFIREQLWLYELKRRRNYKCPPSRR